MFLQTKLHNRRQFLERSALGAGSVLFSSTLLGSCTDHTIPDPGIPDPYSPILGIDVPWNELAKETVKAGLKFAGSEVGGEVGGEILSNLAGIFWPKPNVNIWDQVKGQVETLVDQKIAAAVYQQVSEDLNGLDNSITLYQNELKYGTSTDIKSQWQITKNLFVYALPHFQSAGNELPLLGLFGQFANMYLALLRDAVIDGKSWGRADADHQQDIIDLKKAITDFTAYTTTTYRAGRTHVEQNTKRDDTINESFKTVNAFDRQMAFLVLDFRDTWKYFDTTQYPPGVEVVLTREIYSDPMGSIANSDNPSIVIPLPPPTQPPTQLSFWGYNEGTYGNHLVAAQVTYPEGSGPGGVTTTPRMGAQNLGSIESPLGGTFTLSPGNPVIAVQCTYTRYYINDIILTFNDGTKTYAIGDGTGDPNAKTTTSWSFINASSGPTEFMSSILITGVSYEMGGKAAACIIFGFQDWESPSATLRAIRTLYVTSPKEHSAADFAKAFPKLALPPGLITAELKAARQAH